MLEYFLWLFFLKLDNWKDLSTDALRSRCSMICTIWVTVHIEEGRRVQKS